MKRQEEIRQQSKISGGRWEGDTSLSAGAVLDAINEGVLICRRDSGFILQTNKPLCSMFGYHQNELTGTDPAGLSAGTETSHKENFREKILCSAEKSLPAFHWQCRRQDDRVFPALVRGELLRTAYESVILVTFRDISRQETAETLLGRSRQLATLGELSASIAHEIRQPLQVIRIITDSILFWHEEKAMSMETLHKNILHLKKVSAAARRIEGLITNIQQMLKETTNPETHHLDINQAINGVAGIYTQRLLNHGIKLNLDLDSNMNSINFPLLEFQQVLTNLLNNAIQAHAKRNKEGKQIKLVTSETGDQAILEISDNAVGINNQLREHIFSPLVSSGSSSACLGMGLFIIRKLLQKHNAGISVSNNEAGGASFRLTFPRMASRHPGQDEKTRE